MGRTRWPALLPVLGWLALWPAAALPAQDRGDSIQFAVVEDYPVFQPRPELGGRQLIPVAVIQLPPPYWGDTLPPTALLHPEQVHPRAVIAVLERAARGLGLGWGEGERKFTLVEEHELPPVLSEEELTLARDILARLRQARPDYRPPLSARGRAVTVPVPPRR